MKELTEARKRSAAHRNNGPVPRAWGAFVPWERFMGLLCLVGLRRMSD
jgi:hypothetical protein